MMPKIRPLLDRPVDKLPISDAAGPTSQTGGSVGGDGLDGARPRSAFAELALTVAADGKAETGVRQMVATSGIKTDGKASPGGDATLPFAPGFDLPAFLQVLPRSGSEVAVAAAREPGLAAAVRSLPSAKVGPERRTVDVPDVAIRLPSFLVPPKVDASARQPAAAATVAIEPSPIAVRTRARAETAAVKAAEAVPDASTQTLAARVVVPDAASPATTMPSTPSAGTTPRTTTVALESALRRAVPAPPLDSAPVVMSASASSTSVSPPSPHAEPPARGAAAPSTPSTPSAGTTPRTTTAALESALRRTVPAPPLDSGPVVMPGSASSTSVSPPSPHAEPPARGAAQAPPVSRKDRADAGVRGPRETLRLEPAAILSSLQRSFESGAVRSEPIDRRGHMGGAAPGVEVGSLTTTASLGPSAAATSMSPEALSAQAVRQEQAPVPLQQPVGTEAWQDELRVQLSLMAERGDVSEAVMKLAPEELGELEVRLEMRGGDATLQFTVANADARHAVEAAQSKLRELFTSQGMTVSEFSIFSGLSGQSNPNPGNGSGSRPAPRRPEETDIGRDVVVRSRRTASVVDTYA
jgi:flagellar hook-length control protein FliK